jgi:hypothetical protein
MDKVNYKDDWHFPLIANKEGVSLERINPGLPSADKANWHSAASTAGYGTPGYSNSQYMGGLTTATFSVLPKIFSPDGDGQDDFVLASYSLEEPGYVATVTILDGNGYKVKLLVPNLLLGREGFWKWDGTSDTGQKLPTGIYIIVCEIFNLEGEKKLFKEMVVLGRRYK